MPFILKSFVLILVLCLFLSRSSYAYLDPGSGSYLLQILLAGLLAAGFMLKSFWRNIRDFFARLFSKKKQG